MVFFSIKMSFWDILIKRSYIFFVSLALFLGWKSHGGPLLPSNRFLFFFFAENGAAKKNQILEQKFLIFFCFTHFVLDLFIPIPEVNLSKFLAFSFWVFVEGTRSKFVRGAHLVDKDIHRLVQRHSLPLGHGQKPKAHADVEPFTHAGSMEWLRILLCARSFVFFCLAHSCGWKNARGTLQTLRVKPGRTDRAKTVICVTWYKSMT